MARQKTLAELEKDLTEEFSYISSPGDLCPHLVVDDLGPYCSNGLRDGEPTEGRRQVCDNYSLQLWCLDNEMYAVCSFYQGSLIFD